MNETASTWDFKDRLVAVEDDTMRAEYLYDYTDRRITGSLSTNTRIQRFRLRPGWNLLSLAVSAPRPLRPTPKTRRHHLGSCLESWNAQTGNYSLVRQVAPAGTVLWVHSSTIAVVGIYADPVNRQVSAGATYLRSTGLEA